MSSIPPSPDGVPDRTPPKKSRKQKRRWIARLFVLLLLCFVVIGLLPYLASSMPAVRNFLLARAVPNLNGSITAESASLGWNKPIQFKDVSIRSPMRMPVVQIAEMKGNRPLWKILLKPSVLGIYQVINPRLTIVTYPNGSTSLTEVFMGTDPVAIEPPKHEQVPDVSVTVKIVDGSVTIVDSLSQNAWSAEPINFGFRIRPSAAASDGRAWLEIPAEKVFDHVHVTSQVCRDMLKYIAPVMAEVTTATGTFSIALDQWSFPLDAPQQGKGKGILTVHEFSLGPGPLLQQILTPLGKREHMVSIDETPIRFELDEGRVRHEGLVFYVDRIKFTSSGSVGLEDKTLDMSVVIQMPEVEQIKRPILQALAGQSLTIPIRGTLDKPQVDLQGFQKSGIEALEKTLDRLIEPRDDSARPLLNPDRPLLKRLLAPPEK